MSWNLNILNDNILEIDVKGQNTRSRAIEQAEEIMKLSKKLLITKFLLNYTNLHSENEAEISLTEIYILPEYYRRMGLPRSSKIALILPETSYRMEAINFLAGVFLRSGYSFVLIKNKEKALQYLQKEEVCHSCGCF